MTELKQEITTENYDKTDPFGFLGTLSGTNLHFMNPHEDEICLDDIANALSKNCRYAGQINRFYSVAEHSVLMARYFIDKGEFQKAFTALMHDATEAYLVDVPRPIKPHLIGYIEMEERLMKVIFEKFNVQPMCKDVKELDCHIVHDEAKVLFNSIPDWVKFYRSFGIELKCWTHEQAKSEFENTYHDLMGKLIFDLDIKEK